MLLRYAAARGRFRLAARELLQGGAGAAFAAAAGAKAGVAEARRVLDVTRVPPGRFAELRGGAVRAAARYSLVTWTGEVPRSTSAGSPSSARHCTTRPGTWRPGAGTRSGSARSSTAGSRGPVTTTTALRQFTA